MDYRSVGSNLRKIRVQNKLRQEDVAERANLSIPREIAHLDRLN